MSRAAVGHYCAGHEGLCVMSNKTQSGAAYAIVAFHDLATAFKAVEELAMAKFHHGNGQMLWPTVKRFRGTAMGNV